MVADYERETRFELPGFHKDYGIVSGLNVPMIDNEKKVVGVMIVNRTRWHEYAEPGRRLLQVLANQIALAKQRSEDFQQIEKGNRQLTNIKQARAAIALTASQGNESQTLSQIVKCVVECGWGPGETGVLATVQLYDPARRVLRCEALECRDRNRAKAEKELKIERPVPGKGITVRAAHTRKLQVVNDVHKDKDYVSFHPDTAAEMDCPLIDENRKLLGVLNIEARVRFDENDRKTIESFAELAVNGINTVRRNERLQRANRDLEHTENLVDEGRKLAERMIGLTQIRHDTHRVMSYIVDSIEHIRSDEEFVAHPSVRKELSGIEEHAKSIRDPEGTPLDRSNAERISMVEFLEERVDAYKRQNPPHLLSLA